jgi:GT2 family glycosyltransferase
MDDLAVVIVSTNEGHWLEPCIRTIYEHAGEISIDVVVADNSSTDGTRELVEDRFPQARVVICENHGFGHANNRGYLSSDARYVLFLNPDTEIVSGDFAQLVAWMDERPGVGLVGVRQLLPDGTLHPTIRNRPNALRALGEALGSESLPLRARWLGERELRLDRYERETACDWTIGSFLLVRREALLSSGLLDERLFLFAEETDLCLRIRRAGWKIVHVPDMTIIHHAGKAGINDRRIAQQVFARKQYARLNFSPAHRVAYLGALALRYVIRALAPSRDTGHGRLRRSASRRALRVIVGREGSPFGPPPGEAIIASTVRSEPAVGHTET